MWIAGIMVWLCVGLIARMLWLRITDQVEAGLPYEDRPSWRVFRSWEKPGVVVLLRQHREPYPEARRIRFWTVLLAILEFGAIVSPIMLVLRK